MGYIQVAPHHPIACSVRTSDFQRYMIKWRLSNPGTKHAWSAWVASPQTCFLGSDKNERGRNSSLQPKSYF